MPTVTVGCKLPHGIILQAYVMEDYDEPLFGGGFRTVKRARELPQRMVINGWSHPQNQAPVCQLVSGSAITPNVDKDLWDLWLSQNKDSDIVKNGLIWAHEKAENVSAIGKEKAKLKCGLERLDPNNLPIKKIVPVTRSETA